MYVREREGRPVRRVVRGTCYVLALIVLAGCGQQASHRAAVLPAPLWQSYVSRFVSPEGRVIDTGQSGITTSEGQGYGMLLAVAADDRSRFERLWQWTQRHLGVRPDGLLAWRWRPAGQGHAAGVSDINNATDGDLLVAWALLRAARRWRHDAYEVAARHLAIAIRTTLVTATAIGPVLLPGEKGFVHAQTLTLNPSYWVFPALRALETVDPNPIWQQLRRSGRHLLAEVRYGPAGLPADWLDITAGVPRLSVHKPPRFGFEAIRVPLYWIWDGESANTPALLGVAAFIERPQAAAWVDLVSGQQAGYAPTPGERAVATLIRACLAPAPRTLPPDLDRLPEQADYYNASLILLARLAWATRCAA